MQEPNRFGKIRILSEEEEEQKGIQKRLQRSRPKGVFLRLVVLVLVVSIGVLAVRLGPPLYSKYRDVSSHLQRILAHNYHQLIGGEMVVRPGDNLDTLQLVERLSSLDYLRKLNLPLTPGSYLLAEEHLLLFPPATSRQAGQVRIDLQENIVQLITACRSGRLLEKLELGRPLLTAFDKSLWEVRYPIPYSELPEGLKMAIIAIEDKHFLKHPGIDIRGIGRAAWVNLRHGRVVQGGSTITQQLVKSLINRTGREFGTKLQEVALALMVELAYDKDDIFEAYCNSIYMGRVGPFAIHGMGAAARHLLQKELTELSVEECALLAGLIRSPNSLSPLRHPKKSITRANIVLARMNVLEQALGVRQLQGDAIDSLDIKSKELIPFAWYYQQVQREINTHIKDFSTLSPLRIELPLDPFLQYAAQIQMNCQLDALEKKKKIAQGSLQAGLAALDVESGGVQALIGGRDYTKNQFNRAVSARRQIGSLVKPFVYLAAMAASPGIIPSQFRMVDDLPLVRRIDGKIWRPANYDRRFLGRITWRRAMAESRNIPAIRIGESGGIERVRELLQNLGINEAPDSGPALFLGAVESSPLRMAAAYRSIADGGSFVRPFVIERILENGREIYSGRREKQLLDGEQVSVMTEMLKAVLTEGTGRSVKKHKLQIPAAGKTGTSNRLRDGWFAGFSPQLAIVVWVGRDSNIPMGYTGAASALPIWANLMKSFGGNGESEFHLPDRVSETSFVSVEKRSRKKIIRKKTVKVQVASLVRPEKNHLPVKPKRLHRFPPVETELAAARNYGIRGKGIPLSNQRYRYFD